VFALADRHARASLAGRYLDPVLSARPSSCRANRVARCANYTIAPCLRWDWRRRTHWLRPSIASSRGAMPCGLRWTNGKKSSAPQTPRQPRRCARLASVVEAGAEPANESLGLRDRDFFMRVDDLHRSAQMKNGQEARREH
jgi:hypothetical protein